VKLHLQTAISTVLATGTSQHEIERVSGIDRKTIRTCQQRLTAERAIPAGWPPARWSKFPALATA